MKRSTTLLAAVAASLIGSGCSLVPGLPATPAPCDEVFNAVRCQTMTDHVATELRTTRDQVAGLLVIPEPTPETRDGVTILQTRSGRQSTGSTSSQPGSTPKS